MAETRTVTINADGIQEREVAYVRYELNQQTDVEGQPTGRTRGGKITVKVKSKNDGNTEILEWMMLRFIMHKSTQNSRYKLIFNIYLYINNLDHLLINTYICNILNWNEYECKIL